jgi:hypothetical protein
MNRASPVLRYVGAAALAALSAVAFAQVPPERLYCHSAGYSPPEQLGDREGHSIEVGQYACRSEGGLLDGGWLTGVSIWEYDKANAVLVSGTGITRKPGAGYAAFQQIEGKLALTLSDGKVTGASGTGRSRIVMATGAAAALKGKTVGFTFKITGPGQFVVDVKYE